MEAERRAAAAQTPTARPSAPVEAPRPATTRRAARVRPNALVAVVAVTVGAATTPMDAAMLEQRRGRERNGKPIGRYFMAVQVRPGMAQVAVLEGRNLIEHYVSRPSDDVAQIHGNIYVGRVQNVLPGMEAAFVDIATPKNAVLYRGDVQYDAEDIDRRARTRASRTSCATSS